MSNQSHTEIEEGDEPLRESIGSGQEPPEADVAKKPKKQFEIDIFRAWCKSCGICAAFCPRECIRFEEDGTPVVEHADQCTGCGWCELHCPDFAISVRPRKKPKMTQEEE